MAQEGLRLAQRHIFRSLHRQQALRVSSWVEVSPHRLQLRAECFSRIKQEREKELWKKRSSASPAAARQACSTIVEDVSKQLLAKFDAALCLEDWWHEPTGRDASRLPEEDYVELMQVTANKDQQAWTSCMQECSAWTSPSIDSADADSSQANTTMPVHSSWYIMHCY